MFRPKISHPIITLCIILFFLLAAVTVLQAKTINLSYNIFFPPTHVQAKAAMEYVNEVERRTDDKVKIDCYCGGALTEASQVYTGVAKGIFDMGNSCFAYTRGRFPVMEAVDLPMGYKNGLQASLVANAFAKEFNPKEIHDVKLLYVHAHGPGLLHTRKTPVDSLEDIKGLKIRTTGFSAKVVEALDGIPKAMSQGQTYRSLQKGLVDGTFGPWEVLEGYKQAKVVEYTTECYSIGYTTAMFVAMNKDTWNSLPDDVQRVFDDLADKYVRVHGNAWINADQSGKKLALAKGNEIISLSEEELNRWEKAVQPVIQNYVSETENGGKYVETIRKLMKRYEPEQ